MAIAIGEWDEGSTAEARTCVGVEAYEGETQILLRFAEPESSPWAETELLGRMLSRAEALAHPLKKDFLYVGETIVEQHPALRRFLGSSRPSGTSEGEAMMEATISVPHGIVFVLDPSNRGVVIPAYVDGEVISSNPTCVSVATVPEVDGDLTLRLGKSVTPTNKSILVVFDGLIETPGKRLAIGTPDIDVVLEIDVSEVLTYVVIQVDDPKSPKLVCVNVEARRHEQ